MQSQLQITFRNMQPSQEVEEWIRAAAAKLDNLYNQIMGCRVAVEVPHHHHKKGSAYHIRVDLTVPQGEIVVKREPSLSARACRLDERELKKHAEVNTPHKDLRPAINDTFKAAGRRLQDYARRQRGDIKSRAALSEARVQQNPAPRRLRAPKFRRRTRDLFSQKQRSRRSLSTFEGRNNRPVCRGAWRKRTTSQHCSHCSQAENPAWSKRCRGLGLLSAHKTHSTTRAGVEE